MRRRSNSKSSRPTVFEFDDYRRFLSDTYAHFKEHRKGFSYRSFAKTAGFSSSNYLQLVIKGKRNLTPSSIQKFSAALKLNQSEAEFFENLVHFNQATDPVEKATYFDRLSRKKQFKASRAIKGKELAFYEKWYYSAIRELVNIKGFNESPSWIAKTIQPNISESEARAALELLLEIGLLKRDKSGSLKQADQLIVPTDEIDGFVLRNLHRQMFDRASEAMENINSSKRNVSGSTIGIKESDLSSIQSEINSFRRQLLERYGSQEGSADEVYHLAIQFFPLSGVMG